MRIGSYPPALAAAILLSAGGASAQMEPGVTTALRGGTVHTAVGAPVAGATILIRDGKIVAVGTDVAVPAGARVIDVTGRDVIPGMLDNHSHIGFEIEDVNESASRFAPRYRVIDVLSPDPRHWHDAVNGGVTTVVTGPGSGSVSSGQAAVVKTWGSDWNARILKERGGLKIAMGRKGEAGPSTSMGTTSFLREQLTKAREYADAWNRWRESGERGAPPRRDLDLDVLAAVLRGEERVRAHVHSAHDILSIMRLAEEFDFDLTLHHATEAYKVADAIAAQNVPVVGLPLFLRVGLREDVMRGPLELVERGVLFAFHTDDPVVHSKYQRYNASLGIRYGMSELDALRAVTLNGARIAGVGDRVGSIEVGKDADLVVIEQPWYELTSRIERVLVDGVTAYDRTEAGR